MNYPAFEVFGTQHLVTLLICAAVIYAYPKYYANKNLATQIQGGKIARYNLKKEYFIVNGEKLELISGNLFLIIINLSLIILTFNSIKQRGKSPIYFWIIMNLPLWIFIPMEANLLISAFKNLIFLL